jgi:hypothetical protein
VEFIYEKDNLSLLFDIDLLRRGAKLSRYLGNFRDVSPVERRAMDNDYNSKGKIWPRSIELKTALLTCCNAAVIQYVPKESTSHETSEITTVFCGIYFIAKANESIEVGLRPALLEPTYPGRENSA